MTISEKDLTDYTQEFKFVYSQYQIENFVVDIGITDSRKARQILLEIENRRSNREDAEFNRREHIAKIKIAKEELANETSEGKRELLEIELERLELAVKRNKIRIDGLQREIDVLVSEMKKFANNMDDLKQMLDNPEEERNYWIARLGKQSAVDMLSYGKISSGNMESILNLPAEDQERVIGGAIAFTKKMEIGILTLQDEVVQQLQSQQPTQLLPDLNEEVDPNYDAKNLLSSAKPETGL